MSRRGKCARKARGENEVAKRWQARGTLEARVEIDSASLPLCCGSRQGRLGGRKIKSFLARLRGDFLPEPQPQENSQRLQEFDDGFLVFRFQFFKFCGYVFCFAGVAQNGIAKRYRSAIVHQS
jgi:hypothetical protein